jgi:hypothetical protein
MTELADMLSIVENRAGSECRRFLVSVITQGIIWREIAETAGLDGSHSPEMKALFDELDSLEDHLPSWAEIEDLSRKMKRRKEKL